MRRKISLSIIARFNIFATDVASQIKYYGSALAVLILAVTTSNARAFTQHCNGEKGVYLGIEICRKANVRNWSENIQFQPDIIFYPKSRDDVVNIINDASKNNKRITIVGKGHSWNPLMEGENYLISTLNLNSVEVDRQKKLVTMEAGATIEKVDAVLKKHGLAMPCNIVGTLDITYGGIVATGSHGAGRSCATMSDYVEEIELIKANGEIITINEISHGKNYMNVVRLGLGMMGFITKITMRVQDDFNVEVVDRQENIDNLFNILPNLLRENESVEVLWFPFTEKVIIKTWNETKKELTPYSFAREGVDDIKKVLLHYSFEYFLSWMFIHHPKTIPFLVRRISPHIFPNDVFVTDVAKAIHYINEATNYPINETEIAIPVNNGDLSDVKKAWDAVIKSVKDNEESGFYPLNIVSHMRFLAGSQVLMSPANGNTVTCFMDFGSYYATPGWDKLVNDIWDTWKTIPGVKLHWAKDMKAHEELDVYSMYGEENVTYFLKIQQSLDPNAMFVNNFMGSLFKLGR